MHKYSYWLIILFFSGCTSLNTREIKNPTRNISSIKSVVYASSCFTTEKQIENFEQTTQLDEGQEFSRRNCITHSVLNGEPVNGSQVLILTKLSAKGTKSTKALVACNITNSSNEIIGIGVVVENSTLCEVVSCNIGYTYSKSSCIKQ